MVSIITGNVTGSASVRQARLQGLKSLMKVRDVDSKDARKEIASAKSAQEVSEIVEFHNAYADQVYAATVYAALMD